MRHLMLNKLFGILFTKRLLLLLVWFQSTSIFAQHYSGRHVDDYDGNGNFTATVTYKSTGPIQISGSITGS